MHVLVHSQVGSTGGYARDGQGLVKGLLDRGHSVAVVPSAVAPPISREVASILQHPIRGDFDLQIHHVPPGGSSNLGIGMKQAHPSRRVLWSMWEWDEYGSDSPGFDNAMESFRRYDDLVFYTQQSLDAFKSAGLFDDSSNAFVLQGGIDTSLWKEKPRRQPLEETYVFALVGVMSLRKNPYGVLSAFNELKSEHGEAFNAALVIKTGFPMLPKDYSAPGVIVDDTELTDQELQQFYHNVDCLVNCAWGEGKDLPAMEAVLSGCSAILNDNPGHRGWVHPGVMDLVPSTHMPMTPEVTGYFTGVEEIKTAMWYAYKHRREVSRSSSQVAARVRASFDWSRRIELLGKKLDMPL